MIRTLIYGIREGFLLLIGLTIYLLRQLQPYKCPCCDHEVTEVKEISAMSTGSHYYKCLRCKHRGWVDAPEPHWFSVDCIACDKHGNRQ